MKKALRYLFALSYLVFITQVTIAQPVISGLSLDASTSGNSTNDDLEASFTEGPTVVESAVSWFRNGSADALLYLPFEASAAQALFDYSGSGNDAYIDPNPAAVPTWVSASGYNGSGAFYFGGGDFLHGGDIFPLNSSYTITAWINLDVAGVSNRHILSSQLNNVNNHTFKVGDDGSLAAGHSFGIATVHDPTPLNTAQWYFVAVTFEYATGEMVLWKDGNDVDRAYVAPEYRSVVDAAVLVGALSGGYSFVGTIDDPRLYDRVLSEDQLNIIYNEIDEVTDLETHADEQWFVEVTPFSAGAVGATYTSNTLTLEGPVVSNLSLTTPSPQDLTIDDITASYTSNGSVIKTASAWSRNGAPWSLLYLPSEAGTFNAMLDFSGSNNHTVFSDEIDHKPSWKENWGHNATGAFIYDGTDYLLAGDILPLNSDYTKTAWIYSRGGGFNRHIMSSVLNDENNHFFKVDPDGHLAAGQRWGIHDVIDPAPMATEQWYFVAVTFEYATGEMVLYKNGSVVSTGTVPEQWRAVVDPSVLVGSMAHVYGFFGTIDDAALFGHALSPEQISSLYTNGYDNIVSEETLGGDLWQVDVTPFSVSDVGTTLTSNAVNIHSVFVSDILDQTITEGTAFTSFNLDDHVTTYDFIEDSLVWTTTGNADLVVSIDDVTHMATVSVPHLDWYGSEDITFIATNPNGDSDETEVSFTVQNVNDAPVITAKVDQTTPEDTDLTGVDVVFTDVDPTDSHTINIVSSDANVVVDNLSGNTSGSTYDLVPAENWYGSTQITVTVTDNGTGNLADQDIFTLEVTPVNDPPVLTAIGAQEVDEDNTLTGLSVVFTDIDVDDLHTITVVSDDANVSVVNLSGDISGSTYDLVPAADWSGSAEITVTVTDDGIGALTGSETYTLTVDPVNDAPVLTEIGDQSTDEDVALQLAVTFSDVDAGDSHTITVVSDDANVSVVNLSGDVSGSTYDLVPAADWNGSAEITVTVTDDGAGALSDSETYTFTVEPVNDAPTDITLSNLSVDENSAIGSVVGMFSSSDPDDGDMHSYSFVAGENDDDNASFSIDVDELKTATEVDYETKDVYRIRVQSTDGSGETTVQSFEITVNNMQETDIPDVSEDPEFKVYPVPAIDHINVEIDNPENRELLLTIYSNSGRLIHEERIFGENSRINLDGFSDGVYILRVNGENVYGTRKIIVKDR